MVPTPIDPHRSPAALIAGAALALALALAVMGPAAAAPLRLSLDTVAAPGPTAEAAGPAVAAASAEAEAGEDLSFVAAPDLTFPDVVTSPGTLAPDDDWLHTARVQQDEAAASGADRRLGDFAPTVPAALTISTDPIDEVSLPAARSAAAAATEPTLSTQAEPSALPPLAWAAVPVLGLLLLAGAAAWRVARRVRQGAVASPHGARAAA